MTFTVLALLSGLLLAPPAQAPPAQAPTAQAPPAQEPTSPQGGPSAPHAAAEPPIRTAEPPMPVDEDAIVREMEALIDRSGTARPKDRSRAAELVRKGTEAHDRTEYEKAIALYREAIEIDPLAATAYYELALSCSALGDQTKALDAVVRALALDPKSEGSYVLKGSILDDLGLASQAERTYRALLDVEPRSYLGWINLGICLARQDRNDEAEADIRKAMELHPERPSAYFHLARLASGLGQDYEEERNLEKFLELAKDDPRAGGVRKRLEEMRSHTVSIDKGGPYPGIELQVKLARTLWRSTTHRQKHPDAKSYRLTFEEEKQIDSEIILPEWRKQKSADPSSKSPVYDLLLRIDDAGFLDEYIYYSNQNEIGESARKWIEEHPDRMGKFLAWARSEHLLEDENAKAGQADAGKGASAPSPVMEALSILTTSKVTYTVSEAKAEDAARFQAQERSRFAKSVRLDGPDTIDCRRAAADLRENIKTLGVRAAVAVFRCSLPKEKSFEDAALAITVLGRRLRDLQPAPPGGVFVSDGGVEIRTALSPHWLAYLNAKAAWRMEPTLRVKFGGPEEYRPDLEEEVFAFTAAAEGYLNSQSPGKEKTGAFQKDPVMDEIVEIAKAGQLRGFVLYEVLHKRYGLSLASLSESHANAVWNYLIERVVVPASRPQP